MNSHSSEDADSLDATQGYSRGSHSVQDRIEATMPNRVGRYTVRERLGRGGFADVWLAHDEQLDRQIALKLPRLDRFQNDAQLRAFIEEARTAARLQHPGIVKVFDVGFEGDKPFIVLEYIRGRSLAHLLEHESLSTSATAQMIAEVAEALAHAHEQGFVHRDIKPQNILLDTDDRPHIADFGLAIRHRDPSITTDDVAGTTHYMSPEQVRGENHRIDGRTDVWAIGVIFYGMLTGRLPFMGSTSQEVFQKILYTEPIAPRHIDPNIPGELERICLRCLCQQMSGRYRHATDLAEELAEWIRFTTGGSGSSLRRRGGHIEPPDAAVIPRGLRSFTQEDRDFFLKLIPGPRDRDGLPASIRFWKNRLEEREPDETFSVGLLYGPSGCGKSSMIKAGVLPRLNSDIEPIYIDATSRDTEARILRLLQRRYRKLSKELCLADTLCQLREQSELRAGGKVLIVLDQFEQWLHQWQAGADAELVRALLQCDGGNVQCVLMVRDDFWLPVSRFMRQLELGIVDGTNAMLVDSFDPEHAQRVLCEFGVAYKRMPSNPTEQTEEHAAFISQATADLAENNRLYPVRLAVFVEMVKDREWTPDTLREMGGTQGVGVAFLENSVGSRARPARRVHEAAARGVLGALLPQTGQIKDSSRTRSELVEISKYATSPKDFEDLMHLLDVELRLLTPATSSQEDTSGQASDSTSSHQFASEPTYQLTHDFLVPSIRAWLANELRETRRGRARLLLQEQSELWNSRPSNRALPSLLEWIWLRALTRRTEWTRSQARMMQAARRRLLRQAAIAGAILLIGSIVATAVYEKAEHQRRVGTADVLLSKLMNVGIQDIPQVVDEMEDYRDWTDPILQRIMTDASSSERERIRAAIATLPTTNEHVSWLIDRLINEQLPPRDFPVISESLLPHATLVSEALQQRLADKSVLPHPRLRIAAALAAYDNTFETWHPIAAEIVGSLLRAPATDAEVWIESLLPVAAHLEPELTLQFDSIRTLESARVGVAALCRFGNDGTASLAARLPHANPPRYRALVEGLKRYPIAAQAVREQLTSFSKATVNELGSELRADALPNLILALHELGDDEPFQSFSQKSDDLDVRTSLIHAAIPERLDLAVLMPLIRNSLSADARPVALAAAVAHVDEPMTSNFRSEFHAMILDAFQNDSDVEIHSIAELLLKKIDPAELLRIQATLGGREVKTTDSWFIDAAGHTMCVITPSSEDRAKANVAAKFAISSAEVTLGQMRRYNSAFEGAVEAEADSAVVPASGILVAEALSYCVFLNQLEGIPESEWCYSAANVRARNFLPEEDYLSRSGYRLPTDAEWELACRAGTVTRHFFGNDSRFVDYYGWNRLQAGGQLQPVAVLFPNPYGLFDLYGNVSEMTVTNDGDRMEIRLRGGSVYALPGALTSDYSTPTTESARTASAGFRVVRSMPLN